MSVGTGNLPYPGKSYTPFDILTAEELNEDVANIESLADGTGIGDGAVTKSKIDSTTFATRRNITTNSTVDDLTISTGWFYIQGSGSVSMTGSVTFPQTFTSPPIVTISYAGASGSAPTQISDLTSNPGTTSRTVSSYSITTTGFSVSLVSSANVGTGVYLGVTWTAMGSVA